MLDCSVVIVSWNVRDLLRCCIASVLVALKQRGFSSEILVIDNASHDGSAAMVQQTFPAVRVIETGANLGFAGGVNLGLQQARGRWLCILNPDTELEPAALQILLAFAEQQPRAAVIGPQLRYPDGRLQSSRRRFPTPLTYFLESTLLGRWWPDNRWTQRYHYADQQASVVQQVDWLVGAVLLVRRSAVDQAGPLDQRFWMYSEELEWQRRLSKYGTIWYVPQAVVVHHEGQSSDQAPARKHLAFQRSKLRYVALTDGPGLAVLLHGFLLACYALDWLIEATKWTLGHKRPLRRERMSVYSAVVRQLLQPGPS